jgi:predicted nucleic-acid-binding Zn-ribbon protein
MNIEALKESYQCPKCKGKHPLLTEHAIPRGGPAKIPLPILDRYLFLSCSLCGYTETYNLKIIERVEERATQPVAQEVRR